MGWVEKCIQDIMDTNLVTYWLLWDCLNRAYQMCDRSWSNQAYPKESLIYMPSLKKTLSNQILNQAVTFVRRSDSFLPSKQARNQAIKTKQCIIVGVMLFANLQNSAVSTIFLLLYWHIFILLAEALHILG